MTRRACFSKVSSVAPSDLTLGIVGTIIRDGRLRGKLAQPKEDSRHLTSFKGEHCPPL
jgi:hypothetical protein